MKNPLSFFFKRATTRQALLENAAALREAPEVEFDALAVFQSAKYGTDCASHAFLTVQDHIEWHTGHQDADGRWTIRKFTEMPNVRGSAVPVGDVVQRTTTLKTGIGFFDAVAALAVYEQGQLALGSVCVDLGRATQQSGQMHYTAFAEREGIVFDTSGTPYPTKDGEVTGDGVFSKVALDRARAVQKERSAFFLQGGNNFIDVLIQPSKNDGDHFAQAIQNRLSASYLQDIIDRVQKMDALIDYGFFTAVFLKSTRNMMTMTQHDFNNVISDRYDDYYDSDDDRYDYSGLNKIRDILIGGEKETLPLAINRIVGEIQKIVPKLDMDEVQAQELLSNVASLALYFEVSAARYLAHYDYKDEEKTRRAFINLQGSVDGLERRYQELGGTEETLWKIKSFVLQKPALGEDVVKPEAINIFITRLKRMRKELLGEQDRAEKQVIAGPHRPRTPIVPM